MTDGRGGPCGGRRSGILAALAVVLLSACVPDRPPRLAEPLDPAVEAYLSPDTVRVRRVFPGVWYRFLWSARGPWGVHVVEADLHRCELGLDVVPAPASLGGGGDLATVSDIEGGPEDAGALVAVNGDFFTPEGTPLGPELTDGRLRTARSRPVLAWRPGRGPWMGTARLEGDSVLHVGWPVPLDAPPSTDGPPAPGREGEVVGGYPVLLDRGERVGDLLVKESPGFAASRHPRTAVGYHPPTGRLWLVVVDGRHGEYSLGMTLPELAGLFEALGATEAINLDGGGSSVMLLRGHPVTRPSDDAGERPVANALVLRHDPVRYCVQRGGRETGRPGRDR